MACDLCKSLRGLKPVMMMVAMQVIFAGLNVFYKLATKDGMDLRIVVAYRYIFASIFFAPIAFFVERNSRPKLTWKVIFQAFLCGLLGGSLMQNLYIASLTLTSMTFSTAMLNLIPAMTFIMAVILRLEKLGIRTLEGGAKLVGTAIGIGGAMVMTFYRGSIISIWSKDVDHSRSTISASHMDFRNRLFGAFLGLCVCFSFALWLIIQTRMSRRYPCLLSSTTLIAISGAIQSTLYAVCVQRKWEEWKLGWNIRLWTVAYGGILATGVHFILAAWGVKTRGPVFVSIFNPLAMVLVTIAGLLFLDEKLYVGSLIGAVLIVIGLYVVLWGKGKEMKKSMASGEAPEQLEMPVTTSHDLNNNNQEKQLGTYLEETQKKDHN